jgi:tetratricopeptide (TPR) repeat protein/serine/threonine protein kinase
MSDKPLEQSIFLTALELATPAEREAYLRDVCGNNEALRAAVAELLAAHERAGNILDAPPVAAGGTVAQDNPGACSLEQPGAVIGPYKLIEQIGEGGMGTVWMAQQQEPVKRLVAVKLIKAGMDSRQVIARFEAERQALALMDHPHIAKVLDGGTTGSGRPYFVMDLFKGVPITRYSDEHHLTPRQRLELFLPVCQAVQHAHQKGIIHRDLKPSNVLVALYDGRPVPKVIDFGVAKAAGQALTEKTLVTGFGNIVGTLEYMSPEQAEVNQLDIDTRSDIYSLGVLLYELLAGSPPFTRKELEKAGMLEMLRVIREQEPSKPSTKLSTADGLPTLAANRGTEPARLTKLVRGELDWIVMKAIEKDRNRRYETANGFAMDVQRYLADEPVQACPPSAGYRLRKFARRNKGGLAVAALVLGFLVLLGSGVGWALRDRSARQANVAGQVEVVLAEVDRLQKDQKWPEALAAARRAEAAVVGGEADDETAEQVRRRLKDLAFIDRLEQCRMQGSPWLEVKFDFAGAVRDYARAFRDYGVDIEGQAVETSIDRLKVRPALAIPLAAALDDWAFARRKVSEKDAASWKGLLAVARGIDPDPQRDRLRSAWGRPVSEMHDELRRLAQSIDVRTQLPATIVSLACTLQWVNHSDSAVRLLRDAQFAHPGDFWLNVHLGLALYKQKEHEGAIRFYTAAVSIRPNSVDALNSLGLALRKHKRLDEAITCYCKAIDIDPKYARAYDNLGNALSDQKKLDEAVTAYRTAIEINSKNAITWSNLGNALSKQKRYDEALVAYRTAIDIDPKFAPAHDALGGALRAQKKLGEAIDAYKKAIALDPKCVWAHTSLGIAFADQKKLDDAIACFNKAIELDPKYTPAHANLGLALRDQGKLDDAIASYDRAIELEPDDPLLWNGRGRVHQDLKQYEKAIADHSKAIELDPKYFAAHISLGAVLCDALREYDKAIACFTRAIELEPDVSIAWYNRAMAHRGLKQYEKTIADFSKAIELDPKYTDAHIRLGAVLCDVLREYDKAIACFTWAIELEPNNSTAWHNRAVARRGLKQYDEAIADYSKAIELDPDYASAWGGRHRLYGNLKQYNRAVADYSKAIDGKPDNAMAWLYRGQAYGHLKQYDRAVADFSKVIQLKSDSISAFGARSGAYVLLQQWDKAIADRTKVMELAPKSPVAINQLARLLATCPDPKFRDAAGAVELGKKAVDLAPKNGAFWNTVGIAHYRTGDWKSAIGALEKSMEFRKGGDSFDWFFLAMARWRLGEKSEARKWYDQAVVWMDKNQPENEELRRFRAEAEQLMGVGGAVEVAPAPRQKK